MERVGGLAVYDQVDTGTRKMDKATMIHRLEERLTEEVKIWVEE